MAVGDEMVELEGSISSLIDLLKSSEGGDPLPPEDAAWVDSCLVKNLDISDSEWGSWKDAFLEIMSASMLNHRTLLLDLRLMPFLEELMLRWFLLVMEELNSPVEAPVLNMGQPMKTFCHPNIFRDSPQKFLSDVFLPTYKEEDDNPQDFQELKEISLSNVFLPTYKEEDDSARITDMIDHFDSGLQISFEAHAEVESSTEDIFRVWDLSIPAEEDELVKQLEKALSETSLPSMPSEFDDSGSWKDCKVEPLDDLVVVFQTSL